MTIHIATPEEIDGSLDESEVQVIHLLGARQEELLVHKISDPSLKVALDAREVMIIGGVRFPLVGQPGRPWSDFTTISEFEAWFDSVDPSQAWSWDYLLVKQDPDNWRKIDPSVTPQEVRTALDSSLLAHIWEPNAPTIPLANLTIAHVKDPASTGPTDIRTVLTVTFPADVAVGGWIIVNTDVAAHDMDYSKTIRGEQIKAGQTQMVFNIQWEKGGALATSVASGPNFKNAPLIIW